LKRASASGEEFLSGWNWRKKREKGDDGVDVEGKARSQLAAELSEAVGRGREGY